MSALLLDVGKVILDYNMVRMFSLLAKEKGTDDIEKLRRWWNHAENGSESVRLRGDLGLNERGIHEEFIRVFGRIDFNKFIEIFTYGPDISPVKGFVDFRDRLAKTRKPLFVLSNMNIIHRNYVTEAFSKIFLPHIPLERQYYSCDIGVVKSGNPENFRRIAKIIDIPIKELALLDDTEENINGIRKAGGRGVLFKGNFDDAFKSLKRSKII